MWTWIVLSLLGLGCSDQGAPGSAVPQVVSGPTRVIIVGMDTVRRDDLGVHGQRLGATPNLDRIASESLVFDNAWAPAPRTRPSFRSATTGRWPLDGRTAPTLGMLLKKQGFQTAGFVANVQLAEELGFARGFDTWLLDNMADADVQVDRAVGWLEAHREDDVLLFIHLMDPHIFYQAPEPFLDRFTQADDRQGMPDKYNRKHIIKQARRGLLSDGQKRWIRGRHMGEVAFMDQEIGRLVSAIDALPGRNTVVFHSDHGEEFWDHGGFEHNHSLHDELLRAILWVRPPGGVSDEAHRVSRPVSLVDIVPTVLGTLGVPKETWPTFDGDDLSPFLAGPAPTLAKSLEVRPLQIGHMMYSPEQWGVIVGSDKYILTTGTGRVSWSRDGVSQSGSDSDLEGALSQATGWPVLQGWRLSFSKLSGPLVLRGGRQFGLAEVIDPEDLKSRRANLEWGETPEHQREDVASLVLSQDRRQLDVTPGRVPTGVIFIQGSSESPLTGCDGEPVQPGPAVSLCGQTVSLQRGSYLSESNPGPSVAVDMDPLREASLKALGYLE